MGKQTNFYMLEQDEQEFMAQVLARPEVAIVGTRNREPTPPFLSCLPNLGPADGDEVYSHYGVYLWRRGTPLRMSPPTRAAGVATGLELSWLDTEWSEVIQFNRSSITEKGDLTVGRIWAEMWRYEGNERIYRGEAFEEWYNSLARWVKKHFQVISDAGRLRYYIGPQALAWHEAGGRLRAC